MDRFAYQSLSKRHKKNRMREHVDRHMNQSSSDSTTKKSSARGTCRPIFESVTVQTIEEKPCGGTCRTIYVSSLSNSTTKKSFARGHEDRYAYQSLSKRIRKIVYENTSTDIRISHCPTQHNRLRGERVNFPTVQHVPYRIIKKTCSNMRERITFLQKGQVESV